MRRILAQSVYTTCLEAYVLFRNTHLKKPETFNVSEVKEECDSVYECTCLSLQRRQGR
jgi:hypothetical protein